MRKKRTVMILNEDKKLKTFFSLKIEMVDQINHSKGQTTSSRENKGYLEIFHRQYIRVLGNFILISN